MKYKLCVIIPFRFQNSRQDFKERLLYPLLDKKIPSSVCFLVVDEGSDPDKAQEMQETWYLL